MDSIERARLDAKVRGWQWVTDEFRALRARARAEADRLLGPDRGE